ncbi:Glycosyltransferase involved in cell wall bisynthesis [Oscillospiraceae bacterium]|nr:Glycosyltransferase involved in cell wall bisynthesis [Oscillospiraceae bacterium]
MKTLTVSVAAYNVEKYLPKLIDSVINAENRDMIELLVINDGSGDKTSDIARKYVQQYPDIVRLIDKANGGHGSTINRGIEEATGKYFRALDGDDWLNTTSLDLILKRLQTDECDIVLTDYISCYEGGKDKIESFSGLEDGKEYAFVELAKKIKWMRYHTVIYRTSILKDHNIKLDEHCFYVDSEFMLLPIPYVETIRYYALPLYCYRLGIGGQSVSPESRIRHTGDSLKVADRLLGFYKDLPEDLADQKRKYITDGVAAHMLWHFKTLLMYRTSNQIKTVIERFDKDIRDKAPEVFKAMTTFNSSSTLINLTRRMNYMMYYPASLLKRVKGS